MSAVLELPPGIDLDILCYNDYPYTYKLVRPVCAGSSSRAWARRRGPRTALRHPRGPGRYAYRLLRHVSGTLRPELGAALRHAGIPPEQYHVPRVLREAAPDGLTGSTVGDRPVSGNPDVMRRLDRLEKQDRTTLAREAADRRMATARITNDGLRLLEELEEPATAPRSRPFQMLGPGNAPALRELP